MSDTLYLRSALIDLRANLEAKLRSVAAIEACIEAFGDDASPAMVQRAAGHVEAVKRLHNASSALLCTLDAAVTGALAGAGVRRSRRHRQPSEHQVH